MAMCAGIGAPGTLREIIRGYLGDTSAPERFRDGDVVEAGPVTIGPGVGPTRVGPFVYDQWFSDERGYQRPVELATVRLRNMVEVLTNWEGYVSDPTAIPPAGRDVPVRRGGEGALLVQVEGGAHVLRDHAASVDVPVGIHRRGGGAEPPRTPRRRGGGPGPGQGRPQAGGEAHGPTLRPLPARDQAAGRGPGRHGIRLRRGQAGHRGDDGWEPCRRLHVPAVAVQLGGARRARRGRGGLRERRGRARVVPPRQGAERAEGAAARGHGPVESAAGLHRRRVSPKLWFLRLDPSQLGHVGGLFTGTPDGRYPGLAGLKESGKLMELVEGKRSTSSATESLVSN
ncbi:hypothetical protein THAOC_27477 [Thalassiosira oceanica]|uniref:Uncharacterized protein n=1 Tax=Thalassiosira oceanica TaxID=159749 RepID=K0RIV1_THAOC|nr:hypothetical protein THAOC_27477 [Thalassiosira oceanica]|eukprot:EJK53145.1 hypothetical protein THAOC_27477 [Thalassiosira oceanica]